MRKQNLMKLDGKQVLNVSNDLVSVGLLENKNNKFINKGCALYSGVRYVTLWALFEMFCMLST